MENKNKQWELHRVEERLTYLYWLKKELIPKVREWRKKYKWERLKPKNPNKSDYITNTIFSIINAKKSELLSWLQEFDFIPMSDDAYRNLQMIKRIWEFEWINSKTDKQLADVIHSALLNWDWFMYEWTRHIKRKIKIPFQTQDWYIEFKEEEVTDYDWIYCEYIDWENIYFDWTNIDNANEVIWIKYWDRDDFLNSFWNNPNYKNVNEQIPLWKHYYIATWNPELCIKNNLKDDEIISELRYYNRARDELIILANSIEVLNSPIPYKHKELPFCKFEDYVLSDRFYSMWEYELLEEDEKYKDALRSLNIDVIKAQMWFTVVDPDADFDEATIEIWTNKFARINPKDIAHFSPSISANTIIQAEQSANEDIIIKSWIDFRSQILSQSETATKTAAKTQSARKRINLNLKLNWYSFFERLARLRMSNISLLYSQKQSTIPLKWWNIDKDWIYSPLNKWYWQFVVKPEYVKWVYNILPITESILWISTERDKQDFLNWVQIAWNLIWEDWKPVFNQSKIWQKLAEKWNVSYDELTQKWTINKTPEDIVKELENNNNWIPNDSTSPMSPDFIPPEQRSWAKLNIPTLWWQSNNLM
jgi:hypothetical protein